MRPGVIASQLRVSPTTVRLWWRRFEQGGLAALTSDAPGRGRRPGSSPDIELAVLRATQSCPAESFSLRAVARRAQVSPTTIWRIWKRNAIGRDSPMEFVEVRIRQLISETGEELSRGDASCTGAAGSIPHAKGHGQRSLRR